MADIGALKVANAHRWAAMKITPLLVPTVDRSATRLIAPLAKAHYQAVSARTKVPWYAIAVIHERESSQNWAASLAQGDPWNRVSTHVPKGRGPFQSWEDAAYDALMNCPPYAGRWSDWSIGGLLTLLEQYNGLGYANHGIPSPYIWASTNQYTKGKYVADGVFDPNAVDNQLGCAALLARMALLDPEVATGLAGRVIPTPPPPPSPPKPAPLPLPPPPSPGLWSRLWDWLKK